MLLFFLLLPLYFDKAIFLPNNIFVFPPVLDYHTKTRVSMEPEEPFGNANKYDAELPRAEYLYREVFHHSNTRIDVMDNGKILFGHTLERKLT